MAYRKAFDLNVPLPRVFELLNPVWREDQVKVERAVLQLNEILPAPYLFFLACGQLEPDLFKCKDNRCPVLRRSCNEHVRILGRIREAKQNCTRLANEQIMHPSNTESIPYSKSLLVVKCGHSQARMEVPTRTTADTVP